MKKKIVYLVDHKVRDLMGAALVAHQLAARGIECILEPIEAYQGCLAAHKPDAILFNHLFANHLVDYSKRLADLGVGVAMLLNEGMVETKDYLEFSSGHYHQPHVDLFMCWNGDHYSALKANLIYATSRIEITGTPRFDYYFPPFNKVYPDPFPDQVSTPALKTVLICTNFGLAHYCDLPESHLSWADSWDKRLPSFKDAGIDVRAKIHHQARERFFEYADALLENPSIRLALRPHPREPHTRYLQWINTLDEKQRKQVLFVPEEKIGALINHCDVHVSCDTCTTALEAWMADKPSVALRTAEADLLINPEQWQISTVCESPTTFAALTTQVQHSTNNPEQHARRMDLIKLRCGTADGKASERVAQYMHELICDRTIPDWRKLNTADQRRGYKLKCLKRASLPYHFDPTMEIKRRIAPKRYAQKIAAHDKAITAEDVRLARQLINKALSATG